MYDQEDQDKASAKSRDLDRRKILLAGTAFAAAFFGRIHRKGASPTSCALGPKAEHSRDHG
jgi:hypothetical protein